MLRLDEAKQGYGGFCFLHSGVTGFCNSSRQTGAMASQTPQRAKSSYSKPNPIQVLQCNVLDVNSSKMWTERIALENKYNEAKHVATEEDVRSVLLSEMSKAPKTSSILYRNGNGSELSRLSRVSAESFTSSVMDRIENLQKEILMEQTRRRALEKELAERESRQKSARVFPGRLPDYVSVGQWYDNT